MRILLIGCGTIGRALLDSWVSSNRENQIVVVEPNLENQNMFDLPQVRFVKSIEEVISDFNEDLIVLAVKPQNLRHLAPGLNRRNHDAVIVSTLAGISVKILQNALPKKQKIIRVMPNLSIKNRRSVNLAFISSSISQQEIKSFYEVFTPCGEVFSMENEDQMDGLTPILGSGPAYFFLLAEILFNEVLKAGIQEKDAKRMLDLLFIGSANLLDKNRSYPSLISSVCSKKGVTEVVLEVLRPELEALIGKALKAGLKRISELKNENSD